MLGAITVNVALKPPSLSGGDCNNTCDVAIRQDVEATHLSGGDCNHGWRSTFSDWG